MLTLITLGLLDNLGWVFFGIIVMLVLLIVGLQIILISVKNLKHENNRLLKDLEDVQKDLDNIKQKLEIMLIVENKNATCKDRHAVTLPV